MSKGDGIHYQLGWKEARIFMQAVEKRPSAAFPSSFAVQRTQKYASRLRISGALHLAIFEQPGPSFAIIPSRRAGEMACLPHHPKGNR